MPAIAFSRSIGPVPIDCVVSEQHQSELEITEIPIENGSRITDHAFVLPKRVTLDVATDNAAASYNALVGFQESRAPFTVVTGLKVYTNMLIKSLSADRDAQFSRILRCRALLQEILIVGTAYVQDPAGGTNGTDLSNSTTQKLSANTAGDAVTADRVSGTAITGDSQTSTVTSGTGTNQDQSLLSQVFQ